MPSVDAPLPDPPPVSIVVINHHGRADTVACLRSVAALTYPRLSVVLIDNGCTDFTPAEATQLFSAAHYVRTDHNLGFTGGANLGMRRALDAGADYVFFLNNDTTLDPDAISELVRVARGDRSIGVVGAKLLQMQTPDLLECAGVRVSLKWGRVYQTGFGERDVGQYDATADVAAVSGGAMLLSRAACERLGGFDDRYFAYLEDIDLCIRARAAGFRVVLAPRARVYHKGRGTSGSGTAPRVMYYATRNHLLLMHSHAAGGRWQRCLRAMFVVALNVAYALTSERQRRGERLGAVRRAVQDFRDGRFGEAGATLNLKEAGE